MNPNLKKVYNCVVLDLEDAIKEENINFQRILSMFGDRTGYEASCNEVRINDYIDDLKEIIFSDSFSCASITLITNKDRQKRMHIDGALWNKVVFTVYVIIDSE